MHNKDIEVATLAEEKKKEKQTKGKNKILYNTCYFAIATFMGLSRK